MNDVKHTAEPWHVDEYRTIKTGNGETLLLCGVATPMALGDDMREGWANARRIVAAVNACAGLQTEYLENVGLPEFAGKVLCADMAQQELDRVTTQRDQLLSELGKALDSLEYVEQHLPGLAGYGVRQERIASGRAAIAAVKGGA